MKNLKKSTAAKNDRLVPYSTQIPSRTKRGLGELAKREYGTVAGLGRRVLITYVDDMLVK